MEKVNRVRAVSRSAMEETRIMLERIYHNDMPACRPRRGPSDEAIRYAGFIRFYPMEVKE